jgi:hypothetical protein
MEPDKEGHSHYSIRKEQISFVVTGPDHFRWIGYAFANTSASDIVREDTEEFVDDDEATEPEVDYLGGDGQGEPLFAADPIFDPRLYWLRIVGLRLCVVRREWDYLVNKVEGSVHDWVSNS